MSGEAHHLTLLEAFGVEKRFGGLQALSDVSLSIGKGEIYGLIGPNGAGKTTLFNVLTGAYSCDKGSFVMNGSPLPAGKPESVVERGIARTFQNIRLFREMTALENVMAGHHSRSTAGLWSILLQTRFAREEEREIARRSSELLAYVGLEGRSDHPAKSLSYGEQRRLEIVRALATEPTLLALDEPAAGMNATETLELRDLIRKIRNDGVTVLLIEHDVKLVMSVCDRIAVLNFGKKIAEGTPAEVQASPAVIAAYLGSQRGK